MTWEWIRFFIAAGLLVTGLVFEILAVFGVNRFKKALNRMHAAALGDTLGILFVFLGLIVMRGFSMDSLKLLLVILFFWLASPVSGHMISRLEAMTNQNLGEITVIHLKSGGKTGKRDAADPAGDAGPETETGVGAEAKTAAKPGAETAEPEAKTAAEAEAAHSESRGKAPAGDEGKLSRETEPGEGDRKGVRKNENI